MIKLKNFIFNERKLMFQLEKLDNLLNFNIDLNSLKKILLLLNNEDKEILITNYNEYDYQKNEHFININLIISYYSDIYLKTNIQTKKLIIFYLKYNIKYIKLNFIKKSLFNRKDFCYLIVKNNADIFPFLPQKMRNNYNIALKAIQLNGNNFKYISKELQNNYYFCLTAMKNQSSII